jgi:ComF family protein
MFSKVIHTILDTLFPMACAGCGKGASALCPDCLKAISYRGRECFFCGQRAETANICQNCAAKYPIESIIWLWRYNNEKTKAIIAAFKYRKRTALAPALASHLLVAIKQKNIPPDAIVIPIPLHKDKEHERGFNQAVLLAKNLGLVIDTKNLIRIKSTPPQARTHSRRERQAQIKNAFRVQDARKITGKNILLIDDVATTGATLVEATRILKKSGAGKIYAAVLAHG